MFMKVVVPLALVGGVVMGVSWWHARCLVRRWRQRRGR